jgi:hypothetical protein
MHTFATLQWRSFFVFLQTDRTRSSEIKCVMSASNACLFACLARTWVICRAGPSYTKRKYVYGTLYDVYAVLKKSPYLPYKLELNSYTIYTIFARAGAVNGRPVPCQSQFPLCLRARSLRSSRYSTHKATRLLPLNTVHIVFVEDAECCCGLGSASPKG